MSADSAAIARIAALLPQTQCRRCGYAGCAPYAAAIVRDKVSIALCPPGGTQTYAALAEAVGEARGGPAPADEPSRYAFIVEADCIGCTRCIQACPVDAISGAAGQLHTVVAAWCTGCDLCAPVCPTDCIDMRERPQPALEPSAARARHEARVARQSGRADSRLVELGPVDEGELKAAIAAAVQRAAARRSSGA